MTGLHRVLPEIQALIEASRQHVVSTANLTLVWLYWSVGRVITEDIQLNQKRAEYGEELLMGLAQRLANQYGRGFSRANLQDMRRFCEAFEICPPAASELVFPEIRQTATSESRPAQIRQTPSSKSPAANILQPVARESPAYPIRRTPSAKSADRVTIDFGEHHRLGWSHYRILLSVEAGLKRRFYFDQSAQRRWSVRELQRQIDRALFERVALSRDTRALVRLEKERGPVETVRYEDYSRMLADEGKL